MALARSENSPQRFYSMSAQIRQERNEYYDVLERTQKGAMDTAHRDILALFDHGVLVRNPEGGRSASYSLAPPQQI